MSTVSDFIPALPHSPKDEIKNKPAKAVPSRFRLSRRVQWILAGLGAILLIALAWHFIAALLAGHKKAPPPASVHVAQARRADVAIMAHTIATVVSSATVQVNAQVSGKLISANFQEGQIVHKGDLLFQIDPGPTQNALAQAQGLLAKDQATAQSDLNDEKRYIALYAQNATSQQSRDQAVAVAKGAVAQVNTDQASVNIANENLGYTRITSPIDGKTGPITIQPGNLITVAGTTPLVTITQVQPIKLSFFLPQNQLIQIQNQITAGKLTAVVPMPGAPGGNEKAPVDFISNIVNAATGTIELRATFANEDQRLVPGQSVNIALTLGQITGATVVPRDAVNQGPDSSYVYVVNARSQIVSQTVKVLNDDGANDAISGNVKPGDTVVTDGQLQVVSGAKVAIQKGKVSAPAAGADLPT
jgi:multidrug efflux system membrane fusion protein